MTVTENTAVEITRHEDSLSIWVDANNNGVRDDDDVNIFVTQSGGIYTESPTFKGTIDETLRERIRVLSLGILEGTAEPTAETMLSDAALQFVLKAITPTGEERILPPLPTKQ